MECFACRTPIELASGERVGVRDPCPRCGADLRVCRNCAHHDPTVSGECREPQAERVPDPERANRCDWFAPAAGTRPAGSAAAEREHARAALEALFRKG